MAGETVLSGLINPQVLGDYVDEKLIDNIIFAPLAIEDNKLVGAPGTTVTIPKYGYIGDATVVNENGQITPSQLTATSVDKKVQKYAKAVTITDEAAMSAFGDPVQESGDQLTKSIGSKIEADYVTELQDATLEYGVYNADLKSDTVAGALELFGEDQNETAVLAIAPADLTSLRLDDDFIKATELGQDILIKGTVGGIWGCQIVPTNRLTVESTATRKYSYIMRKGALGFINKKGTTIEDKREADYGRTSYFATKHGIPYLRDESKCIKIVDYKGLDTLTAGITSVAGTSAENDTFIKITVAAPINTKWVYKLGSADVSNAAFGTALSSYTDWTSDTTEIAASTSTKAHVALVWAADSKPLAQYNLTLVKKA